MRPPYVQGMDFNGDGTVNDLLPGTSINQFGGDLGKDHSTWASIDCDRWCS